ncbi:MAG: hypothetical protein AYK19_21820 [Theionarchaea archaeon DG-70-1]|nr:MAG: hypothetical protein AYK19_21820 [Theionarchaea archaeon DG-70-1]
MVIRIEVFYWNTIFGFSCPHCGHTASVKLECPKCGCNVETDYIDEESGSDEMDCYKCYSSLMVEWSDWGKNIKVSILGAPLPEFKCPRCDCNVETDYIDKESGYSEIKCGECASSLMVEWSDWGENFKVSVEKAPPVEFECPICDCNVETDYIDKESGYSEIKCGECASSFGVEWSDWGKNIDVSVEKAPPVEFECARCGYDMKIEDIEEEGVEYDLWCDRCGASLNVEWSDWGKNIEVEISQVPPVEFGCPRCGYDMKIEDADEGEAYEAECNRCGASFEVEWSDWGENIDVNVLSVPPVEFKCPRCRYVMEVDIKEDSGEEYELWCDRCGASLIVEWSDWGENFKVTEIPEW